MRAANQTYAVNPEIQWILDAQAVTFIDPVEAEYIRLNEIGSRIWQALDGKTSLDEIAAKMILEFDGPPEKVRKDVLRFIEHLAANEWLIPGKAEK